MLRRLYPITATTPSRLQNYGLHGGGSAQRNGKFVANFAPERASLGKARVMGIRWLSPSIPGTPEASPVFAAIRSAAGSFSGQSHRLEQLRTSLQNTDNPQARGRRARGVAIDAIACGRNQHISKKRRSNTCSPMRIFNISMERRGSSPRASPKPHRVGAAPHHPRRQRRKHIASRC